MVWWDVSGHLLDRQCHLIHYRAQITGPVTHTNDTCTHTLSLRVPLQSCRRINQHSHTFKEVKVIYCVCVWGVGEGRIGSLGLADANCYIENG